LAREETTLADDEDYCRYRAAQFAKGEMLSFVARLRDDDRFVGVASLKHTPNKEWSLGFWVATPEAGRGYATEAARAVMNYAFSELKAPHLTSFHHAGNIGSQCVLEKLGFARTEIRPQTSLILGEHLDEWHYFLPRPLM
jgi:RimJ/RimL family protein N-acetyltransferase